MAEVIAALHGAGIYEGLGAFNPPGTSPPLQGTACSHGLPSAGRVCPPSPALPTKENRSSPFSCSRPDFESTTRPGDRSELRRIAWSRRSWRTRHADCAAPDPPRCSAPLDRSDRESGKRNKASIMIMGSISPNCCDASILTKASLSGRFKSAPGRLLSNAVMESAGSFRSVDRGGEILEASAPLHSFREIRVSSSPVHPGPLPRKVRASGPPWGGRSSELRPVRCCSGCTCAAAMPGPLVSWRLCRGDGVDAARTLKLALASAVMMAVAFEAFHICLVRRRLRGVRRAGHAAGNTAPRGAGAAAPTAVAGLCSDAPFWLDAAMG